MIQPNRFTEEEQKTVELIQKVFGEKAACYTMVLFTHGDDLEEEQVSIEHFIHRSSPHCVFVNQCNGGYHVLNNRNREPSQVRELLKKINLMVQKNGGSFYTNDMLQEAEKAIREETEQIQRDNPGIDPNDARRKAEEDNEFIRKSVTVGAALGAVVGPVGAAVGAGLGLAVGAIVAAVRNDACVTQ